MAICENCEEDHELSEVLGMTAYSTKLPKDHPDNPNRTRQLCKTCEEDYVDHWNNQWAEYYSSQGA